MKLSLPQPHGIFKKPFEVELPDFTIITGLNGAGKSKLLYAIKDNNIQIIDKDKTLLTTSTIYRYESNDNDKFKAGGYSSSRTGEDVENSIKRIFESYFNAKNNAIRMNQPIEDFLTPQQRVHNLAQIIDIAQKSGKAINNLVFEDFVQHIPMSFVYDHNYISHNFSDLFMLYAYKWYHNKKIKTLHKGGMKKDIKYYNNREFIKNFGEPPWELANQILKAGNLGYQVNYPDLDITNDMHKRFYLEFTDKNGTSISLEDLSSGEKVLMALIFAKYNSEINSGYFPQIILMDEPDAPLHPSMTQQFLNVIEEIFVKKKNIKVIMTTHSPSTVALVENEKSLFVMDKESRTLVQTARDKAISILTAGISTLSIDYINQKQIFVESKNDVFVYKKLYEKLKISLDSPIALNFISTGKDGNGDCEQVKDIVNQLNKYGNKSIYGIIDWDNKHQGNAKVKVLGKNKRYTIENYIFDPIFVAAFLLKEKIISREKLNLTKNESYTDFKNLNNTELQFIADFIVSKIKVPTENKKNKNTQIVHYFNGKQINVPNWYLLYKKDKDNNLEKYILETFPKAKKYKLKEEIITKIIDDIPELIPMDIVELFQSIQNGK